MKQLIQIILFVACTLLATNISAQDNKPVQTIRGSQRLASGTPIPYATVQLLDLPQMGTTTDNDGKFVIKNVPVGRHEFAGLPFLGYEPTIFREIMLTSAKDFGVSRSAE